MNTPPLIEKILEFVEDTMWFAKVSMSVAPGLAATALFPKSSELRESLAKNNRPAAQRIFNTLLNWNGPWQPVVSEYAATYVADIIDWYFCSKRVFSLSSDLTDLLMETDLPDFTPEETRFVADSFAIRLEAPISLGDKGRMYDFIVCTRDPAAHSLSIRAYPAALHSYKRLQVDEKKGLVKKAERGKMGFANKVEAFLDDSVEYGSIQGFTLIPNGSDGYREITERDAGKENRDDFLKVLQIALGLNLYLQTDRNQLDSESRVKVPSKRTERGENITSAADIFSFTTSYALHKRAVSDENGETGKGVRPHFRKGFWRRPKGCGQDPLAKATEWVRPTWVRSDRIKNGEIPLAAVHLASAGVA